MWRDEADNVSSPSMTHLGENIALDKNHLRYSGELTITMEPLHNKMELSIDLKLSPQTPKRRKLQIIS